MTTQVKRLVRTVIAKAGLTTVARRAMRAVRTHGVPVARAKILRTLPHDAEVHTQGLAYANGHLYESSGLIGRSSLRTLDPASGAVLATIPVAGMWAEGIAVVADRLVQITYTEGQALFYRFPDLVRDGSARYDGEGWGLAATADGYVMSDGSAALQFRDRHFAVTSRLPVTLAGRPLTGLNDLEWVNGLIYACVLWHHDIYEIDGQSGAVLRVVDCLSLVERSGRTILNGIAFAPERGAFFVTGKEWPTLFEITIEGAGTPPR